MKLNWRIIDQVRQSNPLVLTLANTVTSGKVADGLSAIGASPIMSVEKNEAAEMAAIADAITINLGTINQQQVAQIIAVLRAANNRRPLVLDPVAVGTISYRLRIAKELLAAYHFTVIRGNASEIAALVGQNYSGHGIDAGNNITTDDYVKIAKKCAIKYNTTVVLTGKIDVITDGYHTYLNKLSSPMLTINVGSGDMLSSIIAAFLSVSSNPWSAASVASTMFATAGVIASKDANRLGSWQTQFYDQLMVIDCGTMRKFIESEDDIND